MSQPDYEISSGNVFKDLGLPDAEELDMKAGLAIHIGQLIRRRGLTQNQAASILGVDQPRVCALMRGYSKNSRWKSCTTTCVRSAATWISVLATRQD